MLRILGAALILLGGALARRELISGARRAQRARRELADALETMEQEIRLLLTPLPRLLKRRYPGAEANAFFARAARSEALPLAGRWADAARALPLPAEERERFASLGARLGGAEDSVCAALSLEAARLRQSYDRTEEQRRTQERLTTVLCLSLSALLCVILI